jgi:DNA-binding MarR family transcriptional regulator
MPFIDIHPLSGAFFANRLDRLADLIVAQGEELLRDAGLDMPSRTVSLILLIGDKRQISAAEIASLLEQPHQLVTQRAEILIDLKLVERRDDPADGRRKMLVLTKGGQEQYHALQIRLAEAANAFSALFKEIDCDLSALVTRATRALDEKPLLKRVQNAAEKLAISDGRTKRKC